MERFFLLPISFVIFSLIFLTTAGLPLASVAAEWNPHQVLSDQDLEDVTTLSAADIQAFLIHRQSGLAFYVTTDTDGLTKPASEIIARVAASYQLNPQFLLALMQREQGIVDLQAPTEAQLAWATGYAVCDRCDKDHPELQPFRGFANQLEQAARRIRQRFLTEISTTGATFTGWGPGISKKVDGLTVTPKNRATAVLYTYTPHLAGNRLLWRIWQTWFSPRYPDGSLLKVVDGREKTVWLIDQGLRREIGSKTVLISRFGSQRPLGVSKEELVRYEVGRPILFADYTLTRAPQGTVYLLVSDERRGLPSEEVFRFLGFKEDEIIDASWEDLASYRDGQPLSQASAFPRGALLQDSQTGAVFFAQDGKKYPVVAREILQNRFGGQKIRPSSQEELDQYETAPALPFRDGTVVGLQGQTDIFVISQGGRRPIPSAEIFLNMGWQWSDVVWSTEKALSIHSLLSPVSLEEGYLPREVITATIDQQL
ncbi:hypothetical protein HY628_01445 [Candidatus Uhrbacteria bacterium]|nr:hypothetical protein [Candidatus Uhrbacteria bacterium]